MDFFYTYTTQEKRSACTKPLRADQCGTCLVMVSLETQAIHVVPVPLKGIAVLRFSLENSSMDECVFQGD